MGRPRRIWIASEYYHVVCRGNQKATIFREESDFKTFFYILNQVHETNPLEIASYCIMTNHFHLQLRSRETPISKVMGLVNKRYADYFNSKYELTGHVFEKRYFGKIIMPERGMLEVSRYIHLNPVEANMVAKEHNYKWSSYKFYHRKSTSYPGFFCLDPILEIFPGTEKEKRQAYKKFIHEKREEKELKKMKNIYLKMPEKV